MSKLQIPSIVILLLTKWNQVAVMGQPATENRNSGQIHWQHNELKQYDTYTFIGCRATLNQKVECSSTSIICFPGKLPCVTNILPCSETIVTKTVSIAKPTSCTLDTITVCNTHSDQCSLCSTKSQPEINTTPSNSPVQQLGIFISTPLPSATVQTRPASLLLSGECGTVLGISVGLLLSVVAIMLVGWICTTIVLLRRGYKRATERERLVTLSYSVNMDV